MSYNVMKRVRSKIRRDTYLAESGMYNYYRTVYGYIAEELWKEHVYYQNLLDEDEVPFYDDFRNHPFIQAFGFQCDDERIRREGIIGEDGLSVEGKLTNAVMFKNVFYEAIKDLSIENLKRIIEDQDTVE